MRANDLQAETALKQGIEGRDVSSSGQEKVMNDDQIVIFRTGSLVEFDSVVGALKEEGIPHFTREETSGGLCLATPCSPSVGPGTWWVVVVPKAVAEEAQSVIARFPFGEKTSPDVWDFQPSKRVQMGWKAYAWVTVLGILLGVLWELMRSMR